MAVPCASSFQCCATARIQTIVLPRDAWNGYEKAGKHFLEYQLRPLTCRHGRDIFLGQLKDGVCKK
jgi:hypothetical protein